MQFAALVAILALGESCLGRTDDEQNHVTSGHPETPNPSKLQAAV
jgi:hypothetical protein